MTEPTHHLRRDVAVELDILLGDVLSSHGWDNLDRARDYLRDALARAWAAGERAGWRGSFPDEPSPVNPYDETDK